MGESTYTQLCAQTQLILGTSCRKFTKLTPILLFTRFEWAVGRYNGHRAIFRLQADTGILRTNSEGLDELEVLSIAAGVHGLDDLLWALRYVQLAFLPQATAVIPSVRYLAVQLISIRAKDHIVT